MDFKNQGEDQVFNMKVQIEPTIKVNKVQYINSRLVARCSVNL